MQRALGHRQSLLRMELDAAALQVDGELSLDYGEELVFMVVLVPVELALLQGRELDIGVDRIGLRAHRRAPPEARYAREAGGAIAANTDMVVVTSTPPSPRPVEQ